MEIVIIGSGNVASQLCYNLYLRKKPVAQVYSRSPISHVLKNQISEVTYDFKYLKKDADLYIICVNDDAIEDVAKNLKEAKLPPKATVAHTSGTKSSQLLSGFDHYGVLYPLQTLRKEALVEFEDIPLLVTAYGSIAYQNITAVANLISKCVYQSTDEERSSYHIPAVMVNNFVNHIYHQAYEYCQLKKLDFKLLIPLLSKTAARIIDGDIPYDIQTGPAKRNDLNTIETHINVLKDMNIDTAVYTAITESIVSTYSHQNENL